MVLATHAHAQVPDLQCFFGVFLVFEGERVCACVCHRVCAALGLLLAGLGPQQNSVPVLEFVVFGENPGF